MPVNTNVIPSTINGIVISFNNPDPGSTTNVNLNSPVDSVVNGETASNNTKFVTVGNSSLGSIGTRFQNPA